jgi:hypothetical protein
VRRRCHHLIRDNGSMPDPEFVSLMDEVSRDNLKTYRMLANQFLSGSANHPRGFRSPIVGRAPFPRTASDSKAFTQVSRHSSQRLLTASGASGGGANMFGKDAKTCMTRCDPAGHQLTLLTSEFWYCWRNNLFIRLIRLLRPCLFLTQLSLVICGNHLVR